MCSGADLTGIVTDIPSGTVFGVIVRVRIVCFDRQKEFIERKDTFSDALTVCVLFLNDLGTKMENFGSVQLN